MKPKPKTGPSATNQAMEEFDKLPEKTKRLMELKQEAEKTTGKAGAEVRKKIHKQSRSK
jgi:hypothetical protein